MGSISDDRQTTSDQRTDSPNPLQDLIDQQIDNLIKDNPGLTFPDESRDILPDPLFFSALSARGKDEPLCPLALVSFKTAPELIEPKTHKEAIANEYTRMH